MLNLMLIFVSVKKVSKSTREKVIYEYVIEN